MQNTLVLRKAFVFLMVLVAIVTIGEYRVSGQSQAINGQIEGIVTDSAGAAVPNATVTVRNIGTGTERSLTTDEGGSFRFPLLPIGAMTADARVRRQPIVSISARP